LGFTVWGKKGNLNVFHIYESVFAKHGLLPKPDPARKTPYDLG
jgi:hypothetical protein